jgi:hypothetical protein
MSIRSPHGTAVMTACTVQANNSGFLIPDALVHRAVRHRGLQVLSIACRVIVGQNAAAPQSTPVGDMGAPRSTMSGRTELMLGS